MAELTRMGLGDVEHYPSIDEVLEHLSCDIIGVCETFLIGKNKINIDGYHFYGNNRKINHKKAKRGSGGVGVFVKDIIEQQYKIEVLDESIEDILWVKLTNEHETFCICVCYLPPKGSTLTNDPEQFYSDLTRQVYMYQNLGKLYIVGDFNSRCSDTSDFIEGVDEIPSRETIDQGSNANGDLLIDFLVDCNICMINGRKGKQDLTCISKRGKSVVDYIFTTHENLNSCIDFNVKTMSDITDSLDLQECSQIPDHSVLQAVIKREAFVPHNTLLKYPTNLKRIPNKPKSYQIPNDFLNDDNAREKIEQTINKIENALADRRDVDEAYSNLFQLIDSEVISKIGYKSAHDDQHKITSRKSKYKPYWNENLQEHWENACEQEKVWLKCKICGPKKKHLREHFVTARNDFDKLLRKEKRNYQLRQQKELFDLSKESNTRDFWRKIGKLGIAKDRRDKIPMEVRLPNGNISKDINVVYETWKNEYEHLFNTSDGEYDEGFLTFIQQQVDHDLVNNIENNSDTLNSDISYQDVEKSVYRAKLNKSDGLDQICAEFLRNNSCVDMIFRIVKFAFDNGVVPETWNQILINPILKPDKDNRDPLGYRGIALMSIPCKIYADILNVRLSSWLEDNNILADEQNGFRKDRGCMEHLYALTTLITNRKIERKSTFACFIDAKKAFDTVNREMLWYKLMALGINGKFLKGLQSLYVDVRYAVKINGYMTDMFNVNLGVKQGCKLSPTLFSVYVNDLADEINSLNLGIPINADSMISILLYADDIVLLAPDEESLQQMLNIVHIWCLKWRLCINFDKTGVVHFRSGSSPRSNFDFSCGNTVVKYDSKYRYLGMWIDEHLDWKFTVREVRKSASRALSALYTKFIACGGMDFDIYEKLYENLVQPVLLYGSSIWGISEHKQLETVQNRACRYFLGAFKNSTNLAVRGDMGWTTVKTKQNIEVMRLFFKLSNLEDDRIVRTIHETSKAKQRSWHSRVLALLRKSELNFLINLNITTKQKLRMAQDKLTAIDQEKWLIDVFDDKNSVNGNKLRTFRRFKNNCKTSLFVKTINFRDHRRILFLNFRCGSLPLAVETGRYTKPTTPLCDRLCLFCNNNFIETEQHFLIDCNFYSDIREELFNYINALNNTFNAFNSDEKFDFIMNCDHAKVLLAKTLHLMFKLKEHAKETALSIGLVAGIAIGCAAAVMLMVGLVYFIHRHRSNVDNTIKMKNIQYGTVK
ncbi:uncharacterized protein [Mytilus edulis]|uniref:uncharacterized protein n=1 Tax=Mytilus edulis TaxID=6550 RepID=UPI0039F0717A